MAGQLDRLVMQPIRQAASGVRGAANTMWQWWLLLQQPLDPVGFAAITTDERIEVARRRDRVGIYPPDHDPRLDSVGVALSGGGIRSATFSLGLLQGLDALGVLRAVDYLSMVSGGGYLGGWWTAWLSRPNRQPGEHFPREERIETERTTDYRQVRPAEAQDAGTDPIHHLRLFGNYLTPRKGLLSADTWRAIAIISRNLILTWLVLVPILVGVVLLGQLYFVAQPFNDEVASVFVRDPSAAEVLPTAALLEDARTHARQALLDRLAVAARLPLALLLLLAWLTALWMHFNNAGSSLTHAINGVVILVILAGVGWPFLAGSPSEAWVTRSDVILLGLVVLIGVWISLRIFSSEWSQEGDGLNSQARANRATQWHSRVLLVLVGSATVLLFAGFAHEVGPAGREVAGRGRDWTKVLSGIATAMAVGSTIFTAFKAAPSGGRDARDIARPTLASRFVFAAAPPLLVICLATVGAVLAHAVMVSVLRDHMTRLAPLSVAAAAGLALCMTFASWENGQLDAQARRVPWLYPLATLVTYVAVVWLVVCRWAGRSARAVAPQLAGVTDALGGTWAWWLAGATLLLALHLTFRLRGRSLRARLLLAFVLTMLFGMTVSSLPELSVTRTMPVFVALVLLSVIGGWVVALGWMADPNALALHNFYKARLVRAYLGASNPRRRDNKRDITETDAGDDLRMTEIRNCEQGGPYPLISTALNLVGGRDLATAQRSAAHFLVSPRYCGSDRTGYRLTAQYMRGAMTLGAAVATSGAAVSPNMGSATPSSALALLLAFLNIRLGLWVPTPDRGSWQEPQTRLWPASLLRESLSQTTDTGSHCYLTDGGHFDNTGLYPLVARACRYIIVSDNGADPDMCFEDMGEAIRRCRIDFRAEISLDITTFRPLYAPQPAGQLRKDLRVRAPAIAHVTLGTIAYHPRHLADLGQAGLDPSGRIVWIKPTVLDNDTVADIRQYALQNTAFPQQSTANQWFGESQFESYRKLGEWSARQAFEAPVQRMPFGPLTRASLEALFT